MNSSSSNAYITFNSQTVMSDTETVLGPKTRTHLLTSDKRNNPQPTGTTAVKAMINQRLQVSSARNDYVYLKNIS